MSCGKIDLRFELMLCRVLRLGRIDYDEACRLQRDLCRQRLDGEIADTLLLLEHPPTITIGKSGQPANRLVSRSVNNLPTNNVMIAEGTKIYDGNGVIQNI